MKANMIARHSLETCGASAGHVLPRNSIRDVRARVGTGWHRTCAGARRDANRECRPTPRAPATPAAPAPLARSRSSAQTDPAAPLNRQTRPAHRRSDRTRTCPRQPTASTQHPLPRDLSPWNMFLSADIVVKAVMIGLAFASVVTWTVWLAKSFELALAKHKLSRALRAIYASSSLAEASEKLGGRRGLDRGLHRSRQARAASFFRHRRQGRHQGARRLAARWPDAARLQETSTPARVSWRPSAPRRPS